jgi:hypothetical protein
MVKTNWFVLKKSYFDIPNHDLCDGKLKKISSVNPPDFSPSFNIGTSYSTEGGSVPSVGDPQTFPLWMQIYFCKLCVCTPVDFIFPLRQHKMFGGTPSDTHILHLPTVHHSTT